MTTFSGHMPTLLEVHHFNMHRSSIVEGFNARLAGLPCQVCLVEVGSTILTSRQCMVATAASVSQI